MIPFRQPTWQEIEPEEIEVTDPTHPLFGARFSLISISNPPIGEAHAFVQYRDYVILKIPISATELGVSTPSLSTSVCQMSWWTTRGKFKELGSNIVYRLLRQLHQQIGRAAVHVMDRGYATYKMLA